MARSSIDDVAESETRTTTERSERRRSVRRDLATNALLAAVVSVLSFTIMPPPNVEWAVGSQLAIAAAVGVAVFVVTSGLLVVPELLRGDE